MTQLGKYELHEEIGRGGFGTVYRATDTALKREVALKVLHPQLTIDPDFLEKFRDEARIVASLESHYIVTIYDLDEADGRVFIAMQYMTGGSLKEKLEQDGHLSFDQTVVIMRHVGKGLGVAHAKGLIHRDIKPANILFDREGNAVISDFGLAKAVQNSSYAAISSMGGVGTPAYRAPELWRGKPPASQATDIYSLGCILYELLTGKVLFDGSTPDEIITQHLIDGPQLPDVFPQNGTEQVRAVLEIALSKDPQQRYADITMFINALETQSAPSEKEAVFARAEEPCTVQTTSARIEVFEPVVIHSDPERPGIGSSMVSEKDGVTMVYVPAGEFLMGSRNDDPEANSNEKPQHTVYLDAYWIDQTPVTNSMFALFLNEEGQNMEKGKPWINTGIFSAIKITKKDGFWWVVKGFEQHPVVNVSWYGAQAYAQWAGKQLPSEAQWEKAARGVDGRTYPWGEGIDCSRANYYGCLGFSGTSPVGHYGERSASPYGAWDMAGNVWEWVADWYSEDYYCNSPQINPNGPSDGLSRVLRGGSWSFDGRHSRSADRVNYFQDAAYISFGFRCARLS